MVNENVIVTKDADVLFVAHAASKDDTRKPMMGLHVEDGIMYATDGRRLHYIPTHLDDGEYEIVKCLKNEVQFKKIDEPDYQFPSVKRIIPERNTETETVCFNFGGHKDEHKYAGIAKLIKWLPENNCINLDFLSDMYGACWDISQHSNGDKILATSDKRSSLIACMRIER